MLLHPPHWSCGRSCSRSHDALDLRDPESWRSKLVTAWASLSLWSLAARRSRARWSGRRHRFSSVGSVVTSLVQGSVEFLEDPSVGIGSVVSFSSSFSSSSFSSSSLGSYCCCTPPPPVGRSPLAGGQLKPRPPPECCCCCSRMICQLQDSWICFCQSKEDFYPK